MPEMPGEAGDKRAYLEHFLQENASQLTGILRAYVVRMRPAPPAVVQSIAEEVFQDAVLETLQHAERFNPAMQPRAWFLAIATNVLRRKQSGTARRARFEVLTSDLSPTEAATTSEADLFDQLAPRFFPGPEQELETREQETDSYLTTIAVNNPSDVWVAGRSAAGNALVEHWDGHSWSIVSQQLPPHAEISGLAISGSKVWVIGDRYDSSQQISKAALIATSC